MGGPNVYEYAHSDPLGAFDPTGRDFWLVRHDVFGVGPDHVSIWWQEGDTFDPTRPHTTFGAGPEAGRLVAGEDRDRDQTAGKDAWFRLCLPVGVSEDEMLQRLRELQAAYQRGPSIPYVLFPVASGRSNSNSYARGLAEAAGFLNVPGSAPAGWWVPGWRFPIPASYFGR